MPRAGEPGSRYNGTGNRGWPLERETTIGDGTDMHIVAINELAGDRQELAGKLAAALGLTNYEALARVRSPGTGPFIVGVFDEEDRANGLAQGLSARGFSVVTLSPAELDAEAGQRIARRFTLEDRLLRIDTARGENLSIPYGDVRLFLRGIGISSSTSMETRTERKFDLATAVISSGLKVMKTVKTVHQVRNEARENFFNLYAGAGLIVAFYENTVVYEGLGPSRALSRSANFLQLLAELRKRSPVARFDDRLLNKAGAAALLGNRLDPEQHMVIATALLSKTLGMSFPVV